MKDAVLLTLLLTTGIAFGQNASQGSAEQGADQGAEGEPITVQMKTPRGGSAGTAAISETPNGLLIRYTASGLPAGEYGVHLHETGRCDPPTFESAGEHFNPMGAAHGFKSEQGPHAGDLPNIHVSGEPSVHEFFAKGVTLQGRGALVDADGAALVVHDGPDDYRSDPAGESGGRIACGVIGR
jgi:superoxide dismutase, Cu-Zn family